MRNHPEVPLSFGLFQDRHRVLVRGLLSNRAFLITSGGVKELRMSSIADYGLESPARAYLVLALSVQDRAEQNSMDILHIQKIIRYFEFLRDKKDIEYSNFKLGGVSYELQENLETLVESGLIARTGKNRLQLTEEGKQAAEELRAKITPDDLKKLTFSKQQLNDLSSDEVMFFMYMLLPETRENSTEAARLLRRSKELTESLFRKGRISSSIGAKWLNIPEVDFQNSLSKLH